MNITDFLDWNILLTFSGACVSVTLLTQLFKGFGDRLPFHVPTRLLSYVISVLLLLLATFFVGSRTLGDYVICFVNGALVSLSSNGSFDLVRSFGCDDTQEDGNDDNT